MWDLNSSIFLSKFVTFVQASFRQILILLKCDSLLIVYVGVLYFGILEVIFTS